MYKIEIRNESSNNPLARGGIICNGINVNCHIEVRSCILLSMCGEVRRSVFLCGTFLGWYFDGKMKPLYLNILRIISSLQFPFYKVVTMEWAMTFDKVSTIGKKRNSDKGLGVIYGWPLYETITLKLIALLLFYIVS